MQTGEQMEDTFDVTIGSDVSCSDGLCGELTGVVVDPITVSMTHLIVMPRHHQEVAARLVPVDLVDSAESGIRLRCTTVEFRALGPAEERRFVPGAPGQWSHGQDRMFSLPYYSTSQTGLRVPMGMGLPGGRPSYVLDRLPKGEVKVRRGEHVHASDGTIGRVKGLVVDPGDDHITHVLLDEGHLWGRKSVAIPIGAVTDVEHGVRLDLTKDEVRDLPTVEVSDPLRAVQTER
jgi:PRC-barrel domain protein